MYNCDTMIVCKNETTKNDGRFARIKMKPCKKKQKKKHEKTHKSQLDVHRRFLPVFETSKIILPTRIDRRTDPSSLMYGPILSDIRTHLKTSSPLHTCTRNPRKTHKGGKQSCDTRGQTRKTLAHEQRLFRSWRTRRDQRTKRLRPGQDDMHLMNLLSHCSFVKTVL